MRRTSIASTVDRAIDACRGCGEIAACSADCNSKPGPSSLRPILMTSAAIERARHVADGVRHAARRPPSSVHPHGHSGDRRSVISSTTPASSSSFPDLYLAIPGSSQAPDQKLRQMRQPSRRAAPAGHRAGRRCGQPCGVNHTSGSSSSGNLVQFVIHRVRCFADEPLSRSDRTRKRFDFLRVRRLTIFTAEMEGRSSRPCWPV